MRLRNALAVAAEGPASPVPNTSCRARKCQCSEPSAGGKRVEGKLLAFKIPQYKNTRLHATSEAPTPSLRRQASHGAAVPSAGHPPLGPSTPADPHPPPPPPPPRPETKMYIKCTCSRKAPQASNTSGKPPYHQPGRSQVLWQWGLVGPNLEVQAPALHHAAEVHGNSEGVGLRNRACRYKDLEL